MMFITHTEPSAAFSVRGKEGPQGDKEWVGKDETHPTLLASHSFQVLWTYNRDTPIYGTSKHTTGK